MSHGRHHFARRYSIHPDGSCYTGERVSRYTVSAVEMNRVKVFLLSEASMKSLYVVFFLHYFARSFTVLALLARQSKKFGRKLIWCFFCDNGSKYGKQPWEHIYINVLFLERRVGLSWEWMRFRGLRGEFQLPRLFVNTLRIRWHVGSNMWRRSLSGADRKLLPSISCSCHPETDWCHI